MTKIKRRAIAVIIIIALMVVGLGYFIFLYITQGASWASFSANSTVYTDGVITVGTITDRNGVVLSTGADDHRAYSGSELIRRSTLHAVGDRWGNIGTGALYIFKDKLMGYDPITGIYSLDGKGGDVVLSISADVNSAALEAMNGRHGTVAVCDCETGELICMMSSATFDPDNMPDNMDSEEYNGAYMNRFLSSSYTPGSTFKLVTMAAAIENIPDFLDKEYLCEGECEIGGDTVTCLGWHGWITPDEALAVSCNCVFAQIAEELGGDVLEKYAEQYGLTGSMSINDVKTEKGNFDKAPDGSNELAWSGIGQYNDLVNPACMLRFVAAIANDGKAPELTMLRSKSAANTTRIMKQETAEMLGEFMNYNVHKTYGEERFPGITMHAKSGTAEIGVTGKSTAWFVGYGEKNHKTLAFVVIIEGGGSGSINGGEVANTVLQAAFENIGG